MLNLQIQTIYTVICRLTLILYKAHPPKYSNSFIAVTILMLSSPMQIIFRFLVIGMDLNFPEQILLIPCPSDMSVFLKLDRQFPSLHFDMRNLSLIIHNLLALNKPDQMQNQTTINGKS